MTHPKRNLYDHVPVERGSDIANLVETYKSMISVNQRVFCSQVHLVRVEEVEELEALLYDALTDLNKRRVGADDDLIMENEKLRVALDDLNADIEHIDAFKNEITSLKKDKAQLMEDKAQLEQSVEKLNKELRDVTVENERLEEAVASLEARVRVEESKLQEETVQEENTVQETASVDLVPVDTAPMDTAPEDTVLEDTVLTEPEPIVASATEDESILMAAAAASIAEEDLEDLPEPDDLEDIPTSAYEYDEPDAYVTDMSEQ